MHAQSLVETRLVVEDMQVRSGRLMVLEACAPAWTSGCAAPWQQRVCSCGVSCVHAEAVERMRTCYESR